MTEVIQTAQRTCSRRGRGGEGPREETHRRWAQVGGRPFLRANPRQPPASQPGPPRPGFPAARGRHEQPIQCSRPLRAPVQRGLLQAEDGDGGSGVCDSRNRMAASPTPTPRTGQDELLVWASGRERGGAGDRGSAVPGGGCGCTPSSDPHLSTFSKQDPQHRSQVIGVGHRDA